MKAILVKYHEATTGLPARYVASDSDGNRIASMASVCQSHRGAADLLCRKMGWSGTLIQGGLGDRGEVFVFAPERGLCPNLAKLSLLMEAANQVIAIGPNQNCLAAMLNLIDVVGAINGDKRSIASLGGAK